MLKRKVPPPSDSAVVDNGAVVNDDGDNSEQPVVILDVSDIDLSEESFSSTTSDDDYFRQQCQANGIELQTVSILNISKCRLGPIGVSNLFTYLMAGHMPNLKHIYLQRNAIGNTGGCTIGNFLSRLDLQTIDISLNDIHSGGGGGEPSTTAAQVISDALASNNTTLRQLIMEKCALGPTGATFLSKSLLGSTTLMKLELAGNMIGPIGSEQLFRALRMNSTLQELGLKMNRIGGCSDQLDIHALSNALLGGNCQLTKLDLSYNDVKCSGCVILYEALAKSTTLKELRLEKNDIGEGGAIALGNALGVNESLETLVLKGNDLYCVGSSAIGSALKSNVTLRTLDLSSCSIDNIGGGVLGRGIAENDSLEHLYLDKNSLGRNSDFDRDYLDPRGFFTIGLSSCESLKTLSLSGNCLAADGHADKWGTAVANAISNNTTLEYVNLSNNSLSEPSIIDAVAAHSNIIYFDFSDNDLENISIETQLLLAKRISKLDIDLSLNQLSSPPLGRLATYTNLRSYLELLANEKTAINRIRLMVLGYGGVGKSTFCRAITTDHTATDDFQSALEPVQEWGSTRVADWASKLGTSWAKEAVDLIRAENIGGDDLPKLIACKDGNSSDDNTIEPSEYLVNMCTRGYESIQVKAFAKAISALLAKGYLSTVGVVKVDGSIQLGDIRLDLVDFAGQVEFLVSHQLLLSSMHTLCMIIQPTDSFGKPDHRHYGSWEYWSKFLSSLGDRRRGSLLLAVSQIDKLEGGVTMASTSGILNEFLCVREIADGAITCDNLLLLDYSTGHITDSMKSVKRTLSKSLDEISHNWWVPASYEALADILRQVSELKSSNHELPILTKNELIQEIDVFCDQSSEDSTLLLRKMKTDAQLLHRAINYLEAVGDVKQAGNDLLLIDPIGWFSGFLSHFIKDDLSVTSIQVSASSLRNRRGTVKLDDIVTALKHEYKSPEQHISQIMKILCRLELCVQIVDSSAVAEIVFLFPCLLPTLPSPSDLVTHLNMNEYTANPTVRGHRFRESSGFIPPGLFVGLLTRLYQKLGAGIMNLSFVWKDTCILTVNRTTRVVLRCDIVTGIIDIIGIATDNEQLFVGAAKGQASIVIWVRHMTKQYLRSYSQLSFEEALLCTNPQCHFNATSYSYKGSIFRLASTSNSNHDSHDCNVEGCWRFLGCGHSLEPMKLRRDCLSVCQTCKKKPTFTLRDKVV